LRKRVNFWGDDNDAKKYHDKESLNRRYFLIPLEEIHLSRGIKISSIETKDRKNVLMIAFIGILIILVASINYINLATAGADTKSKEVAVRKICGASRVGIIKQFILESYLLAFICVSASMLIIWAIFPYFITIGIFYSCLFFAVGSYLECLYLTYAPTGMRLTICFFCQEI